MRNPSLVAGGLLLALAAGLWFLLDDPPAPGPERASATAERAQQPDAGTLTLPLPAPEPDGGIASREEVEPAPESASAAPPLYATPALEGEGFLVRAVEAVSQEPIPYAEILYVDVGQLDQESIQGRMAELRDVDALIEAIATRYRAGADGTVRLPLPTREVWAVARKEPWFGMAQAQELPPGGLTIECQRSLSVAARVVSPEGAPQGGIPVDLRISSAERDDAAISILTGEDGIARFKRLEIFLRDRRDATGCALVIGGQLGVRIAQEFDPAAPPAEPLLLVLPPSGTLEVQILDAAGRPWTAPARVQLALLDPEASKEGEWRRGGENWSDRFAQQGLARFAPAGLGLQFSARALRADGTLIGTAAGPGPLAAGGSARLELLEVGGASFVVGRMIGEDGKPAALTRLEFQIERRSHGSQSSHGNELRTDADGRFRLQVEEPELPPGAQRTLRVLLQKRGTNGASAEADLSVSLPPGDHDLGDLRLGLTPSLASGTVVDEDNRPAVNAHVSLQQKVAYGTEPHEFYWSWVMGCEVFTPEDGSFALHGEVAGDEFLVSCNSRDFWCEGQVVSRGAAGLQLVLRRGGSLRGTLLADEGTAFDNFRIEMNRPGAPPDPVGRNVAPVQLQGAFTIEVLPPGVYDLRLMSRDSGHVYLEVPGVTIVAGEACADPRLNPLDARGRMRSVVLRAQDEQGRPIEQFTVFVLESGGKSNPHFGREGELRLPLEAGALDLVVQSAGCLRTRLRNVSADQTVILRRAPQVRIHVTNPELVPAGFELTLRVDPVADRDLQIWSDSHGTVGADGWAACSAAAFGASTVHAVLLLRTAEGTRGWGLRHDLGEIDVRAGAGAQSFTLTLDPEELTRTVERLRAGS